MCERTVELITINRTLPGTGVEIGILKSHRRVGLADMSGRYAARGSSLPALDDGLAFPERDVDSSSCVF